MSPESIDKLAREIAEKRGISLEEARRGVIQSLEHVNDVRDQEDKDVRPTDPAGGEDAR